MPKLFKRVLSLLTAALLLISLCACAGDTGSNGDGQSSADSDELSDRSSVTVGIMQDLDSLDPHKAVNAGTGEVLFNLFEGLMKASPDGGVIPAVASDYALSADGTRYTFTLREGVTFHNGAAVTAEDILYSLERCAGSENDGAPLIPAFSNFSRAFADEEGRIVVELKEPSLEFLNALTAAIIPAGSGESQAASPVGTGPFAFVSYAPQSTMEMVRYAGYWGGLPRLERVTFKIITDVNTLVLGLKGGTLDMVIHLPNSVASQVEGEFTVLKDTMKLVQALYLNNAVAPFDNELVRQALCHAINVDEILELTSGGYGAKLGTSIYPSFTKYFDESLVGYYEYDVEKAKSLLTEAGYPNGFSMRITIPSNYTPHMNVGEVIVQQLSLVGIRATIEPVEWETWLSETYLGRNFESTVIGFDAATLNAGALLNRWMSTNESNMINFNNPDYDAAMNAAMTCTDEAEQTELYKQAARLLTEHAANVYIQDLADFLVMRSDLDGYEFYPMYVMDLAKVYYAQ